MVQTPLFDTLPSLPSWTYTLILITAVTIYSNSLHGELFFDDEYAILRNADVVSPNPVPLSSYFSNDYWGSPMSDPRSHKSFRPLVVLSFRANYLLSGTLPLGFHIGNVIAHAAVSLLLLPVAHVLLRGDVVGATLTALAFAAHPVHTEAVAGTVGRAEIMCCFFYLAALLAGMAAARPYSTHIGYALLVCACVAASTLCKETGITVFGVLFFYEMLYVMNWLEEDIDPGQEKELQSALSWKWVLRGKIVSWMPDRFWPVFFRQLGYASFGLFFMAWRLSLNEGVLPTWPEKDNPAAVSEDILPKVLNYPYIYAYNLWLLVAPVQLCADYSFESIPLITSLSDPRFALAVAALASLLILAAIASTASTPRLPILAGLALLAVPFLPSTNLFFLVGFLVAERVLYIPSIGFCLLLGYGLSRIPSRKLALALGLLVLVGYSGKTLSRNAEWATEESLWWAAHEVVPDNGKVNFNLGNVYFAKLDYRNAITYFNASLVATPDDPSIFINIATCFAKLDELDTAIEYYEAASKLATNLGQFFNWGAILEHRGQYEEAIRVFHMASEFNPHGGRLALYQDDPGLKALAAVHEGTLLCRVGRGKEGLARFYYATQVNPNLAEAWMRIGLEHAVNNELDQAVAALERSLQLDPSLHHSRDELERIRSGTRRPPPKDSSGSRDSNNIHVEAPKTGISARIDALKKEAAGRPDDPLPFVTMASIFLENGAKDNAERALAAAFGRDADSPEAHALSGKMAWDAGDVTGAQAAYAKATAEHVKDRAGPDVFLAYGAFLSKQGDLEGAIGAFDMVLDKDPDHVLAWTNLGIIYRSLGSMDDATDALTTALELDPLSASALTHMAAIHRGNNKLSKAAKSLRAAYKSVSSSQGKHSDAAISILLDFADVLIAMGKTKPATSALDRILSVHPTHPQALLLLQQLTDAASSP